MKYWILIAALILSLSLTYGQKDTTGFLPTLEVETGAIGSLGKQTPFWIMSNNYGKYSLSNWMLYSGLTLERKLGNKTFDYSYGLEGFQRLEDNSEAYLHQWYVGGKLWFGRIWAGAREEMYGNQDSLLSSGGMLWSGNARPMPKIMVEVPQYTTVPLTFDFVEFKGGMSHGWFEDDRYVKNAWLHHKYLVVRFGGNLPVKFHHGMHHFAQWGGVSTNPEIGRLPSTFNDFIYIFNAKKDRGEDPDVPWGEWFNKVGNHIGSRVFGLDVTLKKFDAGIYWQTIFEDGSGKAYRNIRDGLWGLYFKINEPKADRMFSINRVVLEYFNTTDQSGTFNRDSTGFETGGNDNYFNHFIYRNGWTFHGMTVGTPLITSPRFRGNNFHKWDNLRNNKSKGIHGGISGRFYNLHYLIKYTLHSSYGTNHFPFPEPQKSHSTLLEVTSPFCADLELKFMIAADFSELYGNNLGVGISLRKNFFR